MLLCWVAALALAQDEPAGDEAYTWLRREVSSRLAVDTTFDATGDAPGEDVTEWWNLGKLSLDHHLGASLRAFAEARVRWGVVGEDPGRPYWVANLAEPNWTGEVDLREAFVAWRSEAWAIKVGQQIFVWGKNELFAAADVLNPLDLRYDPLAGLGAMKDARVPVFAMEAGYFAADTGVAVVVLPFFARHRAFLFGHDFALATPGSELGAELSLLNQLDPSIADQVQEGLQGTEIPDESPQNATLALRATSRLGGVDVAATLVYGWDRTPRVRVDPDLALLWARAPAILADPSVLLLDPALNAANQRLLAKVQAGSEILRARYRRMTRLALEVEGTLGDWVARADVGFSPGQTFYADTMRPLWKNALQGAVGLETVHGESWYLSLTGFGLAIFRVPQTERVVLFEPSSLDPGERDTAIFYGGAATGRWRFADHDLTAEGTAIYTSSRDLVTLAQMTYDGVEPHEMRAGVALVTGEKGGTAELFERNDFVFLAYRAVW